jgi:catechol 2,3-dioxygenase-like lactoylglutathione lyase family enzyme
MAPAPLPLLGTFHEVSVAVGDVRAAVEFYEGLGFSQATTGDTYAHPYGVLTDGRVFIGLHQRGAPSPVLSFVRPRVAQSLPAFADAGIALERAHTGDEVFNQLLFLDPFGHAVAVLEARTYSPVAPRPSSLCGEFAEVSLPVADFAAAQAFWEPLGFVASEETGSPYAHLPLTSDYLDLSFHRPRLCDRAMLVFRDPQMPERLARLRERGMTLRAAAALGAGAAFIEGPGDTPLLLLPGEG